MKSGAASGKKKRRDPWHDIKQYLTTQPQDVLIKLLLDVVQRDDRLYQSLLLKAESSGNGGNGSKAFRRAIDDATRTHGFVDWREVGTFADKIDQVVDALAELLKADTTITLMELAEYGIERIENLLEQIDDSNGSISGIVYRLGELHLEACTMASPDPAALAERLLRFETTLPFAVWSFDVTTYRDVLGKSGLQRYRELAQAEWCKLKPQQATDSYDSQRATITRIMERLAEADGDIEALVVIKAEDLSFCYRYLDIAEIWTKAKQPDKALAWAERGLQAFPDQTDNRLRDFLVAVYLKRKRNDEALQLTWVQFEERPTLEHYMKLHAVAGKLRLWPAQRERALTKVAAVIALEASATNRWKPQPSTPNYSLRVAIALWEQDLAAAWESVQQGLCDQGLLIKLAAKLEASRPADAVTLYQRVVPTIVAQTNNTAYAEAIKLIRQVGGVMQSQKQRTQFGDYLAELRLEFKPKRNFIKLLDDVARSAAVGK